MVMKIGESTKAKKIYSKVMSFEKTYPCKNQKLKFKKKRVYKQIYANKYNQFFSISNMIKYYDDVMSHNANMQPFNEFIYPFIIHLLTLLLIVFV